MFILIFDRFLEHYRSAKNPTAVSYKDKPFAKHYNTHHAGCKEPKLKLTIQEKASSTNNRKIKEARIILKNKSDLNDREEQVELKRFTVIN